MHFRVRFRSQHVQCNATPIRRSCRLTRVTHHLVEFSVSFKHDDDDDNINENEQSELHSIDVTADKIPPRRSINHDSEAL